MKYIDPRTASIHLTLSSDLFVGDVISSLTMRTELDFQSLHFDPVLADLAFLSNCADLKSSPVLIVRFQMLLQVLKDVEFIQKCLKSLLIFHALVFGYFLNLFDIKSKTVEVDSRIRSHETVTERIKAVCSCSANACSSLISGSIRRQTVRAKQAGHFPLFNCPTLTPRPTLK